MLRIRTFFLILTLSLVSFGLQAQAGKAHWWQKWIPPKQGKNISKDTHKQKGDLGKINFKDKMVKVSQPDPVPNIPHFDVRAIERPNTSSSKGSRRHGPYTCNQPRPSNVVRAGTSHVCAILAKRPSDPVPMSREDVCSRLSAFNDEIRTMSYRNLTLDLDCTDWIDVDLRDTMSIATYDFDRIFPAVESAVDFSRCNHVVVVTPPHRDYFMTGSGNLPFGLGGLRLISYWTSEQENLVGVTLYNTTALNPPPGLDYGDYDSRMVAEYARFVLRQEFLHGLGLNDHANAYECGSATDSSSSCFPVEYGDWGDPMGSGMWFVHTNGYYKQSLGWSTCCPADPSSSGDHIYTIKKLESADPSPCNCLTIHVGDRTLAVDSSDEWARTLSRYIAVNPETSLERGTLAIRRVSTRLNTTGSFGNSDPSIEDRCATFDVSDSAILDMTPGSRPEQDPIDGYLWTGNAYTDQVTRSFMISALGEDLDDPSSVKVYVGPVDTTPPTISLTLPWNGSTYTASDDGSALISLMATAEDSLRMGRVEFNYKTTGEPDARAERGAWTYVNDGGYYISAMYLPAGSYQVWAVAYDSAGNHTESTRVGITVSGR